jgi:hypothetical protein
VIEKISWKELEHTNISNKKIFEQDNLGFQKGNTNPKELIEFFQLLLSDRFFNDIVKYTNAYCSINNEEQKKNKKKKWSNVDLVEMKCFIGMLYTMGIVRKGRLDEYWTRNNLFSTPGISTLLSCERFRQLYKTIKFCEGSTHPHHIEYENIYNQVILNSQMLYNPDEFLSLDESMIKYSGRKKNKFFMPCKPFRKGFKSYILTGAKLDMY